MSVSNYNQKMSITDKLKKQLDMITESAGVDAKLVITGLSICLFFVFIGYFDQYITTLVGIIYPAFWSIKAIESSETDDDKVYYLIGYYFLLLYLAMAYLLGCLLHILHH